MAEQLRQFDRLHGEIDALSTRLAGVRTLAYVANRPDWLAEPAHWRDVTRALEERLSDTLHEKLMARFIDRRTSALMRGLGRPDDLLAGRCGGRHGHRGGPVRRAPSRLALRRREGRRRVGDKGLARSRAARSGTGNRPPPWPPGRRGRRSVRARAFGDILWRGEAAGALAGGRALRAGRASVWRFWRGVGPRARGAPYGGFCCGRGGPAAVGPQRPRRRSRVGSAQGLGRAVSPTA